DPEQSQRVLRAGAAVGLGLRVHGNQLGPSGGVALAARLGAASVDHANHLAAADIEALAATAAHPTAPGEGPGRLAVDAGPTAPPPAAAPPPSPARTPATSPSAPGPTCTCSTPPPRSTSPTAPACR